MTVPPSTTPRLSLLVPTYNRPDLVEQLLTHLAGQTLAPDQFELILVDDGSSTPVEVDHGRFGFDITLLRRPNGGPGAARNTGLEHCRAPLTLILNDDAVPASDLLERHLEIHAGITGKVAVLGTFTFNEASLRSPFTQLLADSDLLFNYPVLEHGKLLNWTCFWTCNLSIATEALRMVSGFDAELFDRAIVEDVELGYRLEAEGYGVLFREDAKCEHDHAMNPQEYFDRSVNLGRYLARMYKKHGDPTILWCASGKELDSEQKQIFQSTFEAYHSTSAKLIGSLESLDNGQMGQVLGSATCEKLVPLIRQLSFVPFCRGVLIELEDHDPEQIMADGAPTGILTSIIVVSFNAIDQTQRCLQALRAGSTDEHPTEFIFVDNGSTDGTVEFLSDQDDVKLIRNSANLGAPAARNQGIAISKGEQMVFMDNDVMVTPGWLPRLLFHLAIDKYSGCVGCLSDRAAHNQQLEYAGDSSPAALRGFADSLADQNSRQYRPQAMLTSFLLMVSRGLIETIGGFDERFSPWGFEDDDFSMRAHLAGYQNRVAMDVFVRHEPYTGTGKQKAHMALLQRNWARFASKWGMPSGTDYGDLSALRDLSPGDRAFEELHMPIQGQSAEGQHVLAWPDYRDAKSLRELLQVVADEFSGEDDRELFLRVLPGIDGSVDEVLKIVEIACAQAFGDNPSPKVGFIDEKDPKLAAVHALRMCASVNTTGSRKRCTKWLRKTGLPQTSQTS